MSEFSSLEKVNAKRLFLKCKELYEIIFQHFENDSINRASIIVCYNNMLKKSKIHSYKVVCDETNNTPSIIDDNKLVVDIYLRFKEKSAIYIMRLGNE